MRNKRIGIVPGLHPSRGGVYQYSIAMMDALNGWRDDGCELSRYLDGNLLGNPVTQGA
jgi:hypothetical protein